MEVRRRRTGRWNQAFCRYGYLILGIVIVLFLPANIFATSDKYSPDEPFVYPANWGGTGLMEIPTARVMKKHTFRVGISQIYPYRHMYIAGSLFRGLELEGRVTEVLDTEVAPGDPRWEGYGNHRDKVLSLKYQILSEGKYFPALAVGIMDPHGTRLYASQYLVASKQVYPFDFTIGLGNGRFGTRPLPAQGEGMRVELLGNPRAWLDESQFFWGVQFAPSDRYAFMVEYNPIEYHAQYQDPAQAKHFLEPVRSKFNFGFRYNLWDWAVIDLSYQRGDTVGFNFSMPFEIGRPMIPIYNPPYKEPGSKQHLPFEARLIDALAASGFNNIGIDIQGEKMVIDFQNDRYLFTSWALDMALKAMAPLVPETIEEIIIIFKENDIPLFSFHAQRGDILDYVEEKITFNELHFLSRYNTDYIEIPQRPKYIKPGVVFGYQPHFQLFLNDPSGFWKGKLGLSAWLVHKVWSGGRLIVGGAVYPFTDVSSVNEPLSIPVRSDVVDYLKRPFVLERVLVDQLYRLPETDVFAKVAFGILEDQYAGFDGEIARPLWGGRLLAGLSGCLVRKRDPNNPIAIKSEDTNLYTTLFANLRINFPKEDISFDIKYGRFLAGDVGARFTLSKYIRGVIVSAWYSVTDTSIFRDNFNRGYHDKGINVAIPIRLFTGRDSRAVYNQVLSPWTRDVAQDIKHFTSLFDFIGRGTKIFLDKDKNIK